MDVTLIVVSISAAASIVAIVTGGIRVLQFISDRPKRDEVNTIVDGKLEAVYQKIDHVYDDVKFIRSAIEEKRKR